ncbi:MAG: hypothetical protein WD154_06825 [Nitrosopumilaceae archaeon]
MKNKHDHFRPNCPKNEPEMLATHSNGTVYYRCKNCNYFGTIESFTAPFHASEILQQPPCD